MISIKERIEECVVKQLNELYDLEVSRERVVAQKTNPVFEGDLTIVVFSFVKQLKKSPVEIGEQLGDALVGNMKEISSYNVEKGFFRFFILNRYSDSASKN